MKCNAALRSFDTLRAGSREAACPAWRRALKCQLNQSFLSLPEVKLAMSKLV